LASSKRPPKRGGGTGEGPTPKGWLPLKRKKERIRQSNKERIWGGKKNNGRTTSGRGTVKSILMFLQTTYVKKEGGKGVSKKHNGNVVGGQKKVAVGRPFITFRKGK